MPLTFEQFINRMNEDASSNALLENKNTYKQMMQGIIQAYQQLDADVSANIGRAVNVYAKQYKRADRVVWALRWVRLQYVVKFINDAERLGDEGDEFVAWGIKARNKLIGEFTRNNGSSPNQVIAQLQKFSTSEFSTNIMHFLSHTDTTADNYSQQIDGVQFGWKTPDAIFDDLRVAEKAWQKNAKQVIGLATDQYDDAELIMDFGDGFAWWNLNVESCDIEGGAMGHCGNAAAARSGDRILSLRKTITKNGVSRHRPSLTFILNSNNELGEMKGRANEKPNPKYHPYIVALLRSGIVEGIRGGGHAAENNFNIGDLDEKTRDELLSLNPRFETLQGAFHRLGATDEVKQRIVDTAEHTGLPIDGLDIRDDETIILKTWSLDEFTHIVKFEPLYYATINAGDYRIGNPRLAVHDMEDMLHALDDRYLRILADDVGYDGNLASRTDRERLATHLTHSRHLDTIVKLVAKNIANARSDPEWSDYMGLLINACTDAIGWGHQSELYYDEAENLVVLFMDSLGWFVEYAELADAYSNLPDDDAENDWIDDEADSDRSYIRDVIRHGEWLVGDPDFINSHWEEITDPDGNPEDKKLYDKFGKPLEALYSEGPRSTATLSFDPVQIAYDFQKHIDHHESAADETDDLILEILQRAGL